MEEDENDENAQNSNEDTNKDTSNSDNKENDDGNDNVANTVEDDEEENMMTDSPNNDDNSDTMNRKDSQEVDESSEDHDSNASMEENSSDSQEGSQEHNVGDINAEIIDEKKGSLEVSHCKSILANQFEFLPLTYKKGSRFVFSASKRQGTMPSSSTQRLDKGKQKVKEEEEYHEVEKEFEIIHVNSD